MTRHTWLFWRHKNNQKTLRTVLLCWKTSNEFVRVFLTGLVLTRGSNNFQHLDWWVHVKPIILSFPLAVWVRRGTWLFCRQAIIRSVSITTPVLPTPAVQWTTTGCTSWPCPRLTVCLADSNSSRNSIKARECRILTLILWIAYTKEAWFVSL